MSRLIGLRKERTDNLAAAEQFVKQAESQHREMSSSEKVLFDTAMQSVAALGREIKEIESRNSLAARFEELGPGFLLDAGRPVPEDFNPRGKSTTLREAMKLATPEQLEQVKSFTRYLSGDMTALADLTPSGDASVIIPTTIAGVVERNYSAFTPVLNVCRKWPTVTGESARFPVISDSEDAEILAPAADTGADATVTGNTPPTSLGGPLMGAYKFSSKPVFVPYETITDAMLDVVDEILSALFARILRFQNLKYTVGSGSGEPAGFIHDATAYSLDSGTALDLDIALDLAYQVPQLYRPNGVYMASDTTIKYLRKLKTGLSGDKRNLWKDVFEEGNATLGTPAKLHGYPIFVNNDMDSVGTDGTFDGSFPLAFGDFSRFVVRQAEQGRTRIYRYTVPAKDGGAVIAFQRSDSKLLVSAAMAKLTAATS